MYSFGADVELGHEDLGISTAEVVQMTTVELTALRERLTEAVLDALDEQLIGEVQEAAELTEYQRSFIVRNIRQPATAAKPKPTATTKPSRKVR
jgi:hypothetical protein